ncbi:MAG: hypothetical protein FXF47_03155 [Candidatus Mcinerneyibacterium aminivorans]|jgi:succinate dehydrogenase/fumarate reductase-like Fe-S protein|uniref:Uncharacterized protein n=1 Tax=Candidatus Mcinerneyibacterium aminivorans TaxID=2703815 RepID=A0A5D0MK75_9BACT|nr:MAG: hypothetical protein FXF47_03155 [Candidatus Mcinerneyibacterium aminivorans]
MDDDIKKKLLKKDTEFSERLEYLIRDVDIIEKDVRDIETDLHDMFKEFEEIKKLIKNKENNKKQNKIFDKKDDSKK